MAKKVPMLKELKRKYDDDKNSRAFGALAEAYRKSGQVKKSIQLLKKHLPDHPDFTLAYLTLAKCYREIKKEEEAFELLSPIVEQNKENLILQETYGDLCEDLGFNTKAIEYYKRVLFYKPKDKNVRLKMQKLEEGVSPVKTSQTIKSEVRTDDWKQIDSTNIPDTPKQIEPNGFMSYFDQKMESFDSSILDNLSLDMIKDSNVSDESLLTELTLSSAPPEDEAPSSGQAPGHVKDIEIEQKLTNNSELEKVQNIKALDLVNSDTSNGNEQHPSEEIIIEKVHTFLALLCSRRDAGFLSKAS